MTNSPPYEAMAERLADHLSATYGVTAAHTSVLAAVAAMHGEKDWHTLIARQGAVAEGREMPEAAEVCASHETGRWAIDEATKKLILQSVAECIPELAGAVEGGPRKAWMCAGQTYVLSLALHDALRSKLPSRLVDTIGYRTRVGEVDPLATILATVLDKYGWLVTEPQAYEHLGRSTHWDILVGNRHYVGAVVLRLPQDVRARLPTVQILGRDPLVVTIARPTCLGPRRLS